MGNRFNPLFGKNTKNLAFGLGWIGQWTEQVKDRARAHFNTGRHDMAHGRVMTGGHHEAKVDVAKRLFKKLHIRIKIDTKRHQNIGRTRFGGSRAVAVFCNGGTRGGSHNRSPGRNIIGAAAITAGTAGIDRVFRGDDAGCLFTHDAGGACDFINGLTAKAQAHQECPHLRWRCLTRHQHVKGHFGHAFAQFLAICDFGQNRLHIMISRHRVFLGCGPAPVRLRYSR